MYFKDLEVGQIFEYLEDGYLYIKVQHPVGYVPSSSLISNYGGIWLKQFQNRAQTERNEVYEFERKDVVKPMKIVFAGKPKPVFCQPEPAVDEISLNYTIYREKITGNTSKVERIGVAAKSTMAELICSTYNKNPTEWYYFYR